MSLLSDPRLRPIEEVEADKAVSLKKTHKKKRTDLQLFEKSRRRHHHHKHGVKHVDGNENDDDLKHARRISIDNETP